MAYKQQLHTVNWHIVLKKKMRVAKKLGITYTPKNSAWLRGNGC